MLKKVSLITLLTFSALSASDNLKPMIQIGYDWGGTTLATVEHPATYYSYSDITKIRAGAGLNLEVGASLSNPDSHMELQFLIGYKFEHDSADNGSVTWDVIPFTALAMFKSQRWKFGGGVTYHLNPEIDGSFSGYENGKPFTDKIDDQYENAFGGVAQIQYMATNALAIGVKGTFIEYKLKEDPTITAKGNSIGLNFSYTFGNERSRFR
jgi:hypothetical protein